MIKIETDKLREVMKSSQYGILSESIFDYTQLIQLSGKDDKLKFNFNGLDIFSQFSITLEEPLTEEFKVTIKADLFDKIINTINDNDITLDISDGVVKIIYSEGDISIPTIACNHKFNEILLNKDDYTQITKLDPDLWQTITSTQVPLISPVSIYLPYRYVCITDKILTGDMSCNIFSIVDSNDRIDENLYALYTPSQLRFLSSQKEHDNITYYKNDSENKLVVNYIVDDIECLIEIQLSMIKDKQRGDYNTEPIINMFKYDLEKGYYEMNINDLKPHLTIANILDKGINVNLKFKNNKLKIKNKYINTSITLDPKNNPADISLDFDLSKFNIIVEAIPDKVIKITPIFVDDEINGIMFITDSVNYALAAVND